jgi:hypothetical protein
MYHRQLFASGETIREQKDEIERLRLTDAEREAINVAQNLMAGTAYARSLGSLLERLGGSQCVTK